MLKSQVNEERSRSVFINLVVVVVFASLMLAFILYFNKNSPDIKRLVLQKFAEQLTKSTLNAHWQWQKEGRPNSIMQLQYDGQGNKSQSRTLGMSDLGWPKVEPSSLGCATFWETILHSPMEIKGFKMYAEFYDGIQLSNNALASICRFRLSTGPYFDYGVYRGQVSQVKD
ncbi:MAG: hypothetical protein ACI9C4_001284 [Paraglaciecola sp.]|jgi:hypothetical protein